MTVGACSQDDSANAARARRAQQQAAQQAAQAARAAREAQSQAGQQAEGQAAATARTAVDPARQEAARAANAAHPCACKRLPAPQWDAANRQADRATDRRVSAPEPRTLQKGMGGEDVRALQRQLNAQGARLREDGRFGRKTERAVRAAQQRAGIAVDGIAGPQTRQALEGRAPDARRPDVSPAPRRPDDARRPPPSGGQKPGGADRVPATGDKQQDTTTVAGAARFLLNSPNVKFWDKLSTGSDRKNLERLARGEKAMVDAKGRQVDVNPRMMQALVEMAKRGPIQINALTGGAHSHNSRHYEGAAVDLSSRVGDARQIERIAQQFGGRRNSERTHIHLSF